MVFVQNTKLKEISLEVDTEMDKKDVRSVIFIYFGVVCGVLVVGINFDLNHVIEN